ncbi:hypothetical protein C8R45DRAFT_940196 [Mycena sanguinolenta]|nr:hypothetical protein C8R45DRAFT_940196 [Mycena sanguinolenta]
MDKNKDRRDQTLEALAFFIEQQKAILARTQSEVVQLRKLKREAGLVAPDVGELAKQLSGSAFRLSEHAVEDWGGHTPDRVPKNIDWELFADKDPYPLQSLAHAARTAYAQRNTYIYTPATPIPPPVQPPPLDLLQQSPVSPIRRIQNPLVLQNPFTQQNSSRCAENSDSREEDEATLSPLQKLVRNAKKSILDPVLVPIQLSLQAEDAALALESGDVDVDMPPASALDATGAHAHGLRSKNTSASCNGTANTKKNGKANGAARMPPRGRAGLFTRRPRAESAASAPVAASAPPHSASASAPLPHHDIRMGGDVEGASASGSSTAVDSGSSASPPAAFATPALPKTRARARADSVSSPVQANTMSSPIASYGAGVVDDVPLALGKPVRAKRATEKLAMAQGQGQGGCEATTSPRVGRREAKEKEAEAEKKKAEAEKTTAKETEAHKDEEEGVKEEKRRKRVILKLPPAAALVGRTTPTPAVASAPVRRSSRGGRSVPVPAPAPTSAPSPASTSAVDPDPDADDDDEGEDEEEQEHNGAEDEENEPAEDKDKPVLGKRKRADKPRGDTYKVMWSASEQNQLERLLEEVPASDPRRSFLAPTLPPRPSPFPSTVLLPSSFFFLPGPSLFQPTRPPTALSKHDSQHPQIPKNLNRDGGPAHAAAGVEPGAEVFAEVEAVWRCRAGLNIISSVVLRRDPAGICPDIRPKEKDQQARGSAVTRPCDSRNRLTAPGASA